MNVRLTKVCLHGPSKEAGFLRIFLRSDGQEYANKTTRKIKHQVANFFNESLEVESERPKLQILIYYSEQNTEMELLSRFEFLYGEACSLQKKIKYTGDVVSQDAQLKLYWSWNIQRQESHQHSQFTRDFLNIDTPKKSNFLDPAQASEPDELKIFGKQFRVYSPIHRKSCQMDRNMDTIMSEKGDSSPPKNIYRTPNYNLNSARRQKGIKIMSSKISKSADTRSKTNSHEQIAGENKAIKDINKSTLKIKDNQVKIMNETFIKVELQQNKQNAKKLVAVKAGNIRSDSRRYSLNMNKLGAVVASTVGIFAGFVAGYVSNI